MTKIKNQTDTIYVSINLDDLGYLKRIYNIAVKKNKETFMYKGSILLTSYAKYLIEYMDTKYAKSRK